MKEDNTDDPRKPARSPRGGRGRPAPRGPRSASAPGEGVGGTDDRALPRSAAAREGDTPAGPTEEDVRRRAYDLYLSRGGAPGDEAADWYRAEAELRALRSSTAGDATQRDHPRSA